MSISLLYCDELAFVRPNIAESFWASIQPTLSTGGKCIVTSTPCSDEDLFAQLWRDANKTYDVYGNSTELGINGFKAFKALWYENPEYDQKWSDTMRAKLGELKYRREIECEFLADAETLINPFTLSELQGVEPLFTEGQIRWYSKPSKGNCYAISLDPALGTGGDFAAIQVYEVNSTTQIGEWKHNKTTIPEQIKLLANIAKYIEEITAEPNNIYYSLENNSIGEGALISLHEYGEHNIPGSFLSEPGKKRKGFNTTHKTKVAACSKFKTLVETGRLKIHSKSLVSELKTFVAVNNTYRARIGDHDDLVMSSLLAVRMIQQLATFHGDLESQIRDHDEFIAPLPFFAVIS